MRCEPTFTDPTHINWSDIKNVWYLACTNIIKTYRWSFETSCRVVNIFYVERMFYLLNKCYSNQSECQIRKTRCHHRHLVFFVSCAFLPLAIIFFAPFTFFQSVFVLSLLYSEWYVSANGCEERNIHTHSHQISARCERTTTTNNNII